MRVNQDGMLVSVGRIRFRSFVDMLHRSQEKGLEQRETDLYGKRRPHLSHYIAGGRLVSGYGQRPFSLEPQPINPASPDDNEREEDQARDA